MRSLCDSKIGQTKEERNAEEENAIDEGACKSLSRLRHASCDEDVRYVVDDVDASSCANHGREYVGPVIWVLGKDCKEQNRHDPACGTEPEKPERVRMICDMW